jgi:hypothetical protein
VVWIALPFTTWVPPFDTWVLLAVPASSWVPKLPMTAPLPAPLEMPSAVWRPLYAVRRGGLPSTTD